MEPFNEELFMKELSELAKKHNLKGCIFAGQNTDQKMIGIFCIEKYGIGCNINDELLAYAHAARIYQSAREKMLNRMDRI